MRHLQALCVLSLAMRCPGHREGALLLPISPGMSQHCSSYSTLALKFYFFFFFKGRKRNKVLKEKRYIFLTAAEPLLTDPTWLLDRIPAREICMCEESRVRNLLGSPVLHTVREMLNGEGVFLQGNTSTRPDPVSPSTQPGARSNL